MNHGPLLRWYCLAALLQVCSLLAAQDLHFTQFFAAPHTVNPALIGGFAGDYRVGVNYRTQWVTVPVPYQTVGLFGDMSFGRKNAINNYVSIGMNLLADRAGDGQLTVLKAMASGAYHWLPSPSGNHDLTIGMQLGWVEKKVDFSRLYWDSQWNDKGFDTGLPSGEQYVNSQIGYVDAAAGITYAFQGSGRFSGFAGMAMYHLLRPKDSFYEHANRLGLRPVAFGACYLQVTDAFSLIPAFFYQTQKKASEKVMGAMVRYSLHFLEGTLSGSRSFYAGMYVRPGDALIPLAGYEWNQWRFLVNYDINTSSLRAASGGFGAFELSLVYVGVVKKNTPILIDIPCPRF